MKRSDIDMIAQDMVCIAERADGKGKVEGYYFCLHHNDGRKHLHHLIIPLEVDLSKGTPLDEIQVEIKPESITLKALEPRVMTLEEITNTDVVWLECYGICSNLFKAALPGHPLNINDATWDFQTHPYTETMFLVEYGKNWRCWTSRPTDEQREKVKWE